MKKAIDIFFIILIFFVIYFLQVNFFTWFNIAGIMPNLFIILIMVIGLFMKKDFGFFFGILFGLLLDIFIGTRIGINAITFAIVGLVSGYLDKNFSKDNRMTVMLMTMLITIVAELITYILKISFCGAIFEIASFIKIVLIEMVYNAILIIIFYPIFFSFGNRLEQDFINNNSFLKFF